MKRIIAIMSVLLSIVSVSAQKAVDRRDLLTIVDGNNCTVYYDRESRKPLKGDYRIKRGHNVEMVTLKNGIIDGDYNRYRNGELRESGKYVKGKREGMFTEYYGGGVVKKKTPMANGKIDGTVIGYFRDGNIDSKEYYRMGVEHGVEQHYDNTTNEQVFQTNYIDGKKEGEEWEIADNGNDTHSRIVRHYKNGVLNGVYTNELTRNGKLYYTIEGKYSNGEKTGQWIEHNYDTDSVITTYYNGEGGA